MTALLAARPFPALDHCYWDRGALTVVARVAPDHPFAGERHPGLLVLETLVQAARRALGRPDLGLAAVDAAVLRVLPPGPLTLRPTITPTPDGCAVAADGVAVHCARGPADAYPATLLLAAFARACSGPGPAEPLALRGVAVRGPARPGQVLAHRVSARPDGSITGWTEVGGRRVLTVDRFAPGEAATTG